MNTLNEENKKLRQTLILIKNLSPLEDISIAKSMAKIVTDKIPFRDPDTGEEEDTCKQEIKS